MSLVTSHQHLINVPTILSEKKHDLEYRFVPVPSSLINI
jgi:hypothetical protein